MAQKRSRDYDINISSENKMRKSEEIVEISDESDGEDQLNSFSFNGLSNTGYLCNNISSITTSNSVTTLSTAVEDANGQGQSYIKSKTLWGIFGDVHFQEQGLNEIVKTGEWICQEFEKAGVTEIICLGDIINTRESVPVQTHSKMIQFFDKLSEIPTCSTIHILLGLDALGMRENRKKFKLYRGIEQVRMADQNFECLMIPYHEDSSIIKDWIANRYINPKEKSEIVAFCHMAINGSIQRLQIDNRQKIYSRKYIEKGSSGKRKNTAPKYLSEFRYTISGHFHHHHYVSHNVLYCGAPMQHNFKDAGDMDRGVIIFDPYDKMNNPVHFIKNPNVDRFRILRISGMNELKDLNQYHGKHVSIVIESQSPHTISVDTVQQQLLEHGAKQAMKNPRVNRMHHSNLKSTGTSSSPPINETISFLCFEDFIEDYVASTSVQGLPGVELIKLGKKIIRESSEQENQKSHKVFLADLKRIVMKNFLSVQSAEINVGEMDHGVWIIEGENGTGKSTILEALSWCIFGKFIRSDMKVDYAVNDKLRKNCMVSVSFGNGYEFKRYRKDDIHKNDILCFYNGTPLSDFEKASSRARQKQVEILIGIEFDTFVKSCVLSDQHLAMYLGDKVNRRKLIEQLLGFEQFDDFLSTVKDRKKDLENQRIVINEQKKDHTRNIEELKKKIIQSEQRRNKVEKDQENLSAARALVQEYERQYKKMRKETKDKLIALKEEWEIHQEQEYNMCQIDQYKKEMKEIEDELEYLSTSLSHDEGELEVVLFELGNSSLDSLKEELKYLIGDRERTECELVHLNEKISDTQRLMGHKHCPYCQQSVSNSFIQDKMNEQKENERKKEELEMKKISDNQKYYHLSEQIDKEQQLHSSLLENKAMLIERKQSSMREEKKLIKQYEKIMTSIEDHEKKLQKNYIDWYSSHQLPYEDMKDILNMELSEKEKNLTEKKCELRMQETIVNQDVRKLINDSSEMNHELLSHKERFKKLTENEEELETMYNAYKYWEKAFGKKDMEFKTMRTYMLCKSIDQLNKTLEQYAMKLGHNTLRLVFDNDLTLKECDYGKRSSGQRKRNHLQLFFALFHLVQQRCLFRPTFLMLDEVFDALDRGGQEQVLHCLFNLQSHKLKHIFVVSHSPHVSSSHEALTNEEDDILTSTTASDVDIGSSGNHSHSHKRQRILVSLTERGTVYRIINS